MIRMKLASEAKSMVNRMDRFHARDAEFKKAASRKMAEIFRDELKSVVEGQRFERVVPLSRSWMEQKSRRGLDPRILMATKAYVASIRVEPAGEGMFGVMADFERAKQLEYGTKAMPPRPHWDQVFREVKKKVSEMLGKKLMVDFFGKRALTGG